MFIEESNDKNIDFNRYKLNNRSGESTFDSRKFQFDYYFFKYS